MKHLKKIFLSLTLICALTAAVFAGETGTPPCAPGETGTPPCACAPGETSSPPCPTQSVNDDPVVLGETSTLPSLPAVDMTDISEAVLWALSLF